MLSRRHPSFRFALLIACLISLPHNALAECDGADEECVPIGKWDLQLGLGVGMRSNPVIGRSNIPLAVVPKISYYGKRFFLDNLELGFALHENPFSSIAIVATPGYDSVFFARFDPQNLFVAGSGSAASAIAPSADPTVTPDELLKRKRRLSYLAGPEWNFNYGPVAGQFVLLKEFTGRHDGTEVRAAIASDLLKKARGTMTASIGATWKSAAIVNYYYGDPTYYRASSALNPFAKLAYTQRLNSKWKLNGFYHFELLDDAIAKSPIIESNVINTFFVGVFYSF
jgi:MipA family protein